MKKIAIVVAGAVMLAVSCKEENVDPNAAARQSAIADIKKWEAQMHGSMQIDPKLADSALQAYNNFVTKFPEDSLCGAFVYKSAEIQTATGKFDQALKSYKLISFKYPKFELAPEALFQQAVLLDNYMDQDGAARMVYEDVIKKYPKTRLADDSKAAIDNLGKSDQELIEEFRRRNGEK